MRNPAEVTTEDLIATIHGFDIYKAMDKVTFAYLVEFVRRCGESAAKAFQTYGRFGCAPRDAEFIYSGVAIIGLVYKLGHSGEVCGYCARTDKSVHFMTIGAAEAWVRGAHVQGSKAEVRS